MFSDCSESQSQNVQIYGYVFHDFNWPMSWSNIEDTVVPLERQIIRTLTCWPLVRKTVRSSIGTRMGKSTELGMFFHRTTRIILIGLRGWHWLERCRIWLPCGRKWWKHLIWTNQLHFLIEYLGCTRRECKPKEVIVDEHAKMYESRNSAGATEKLAGCEKPSRKDGCVVLRLWKDMFKNMRWKILRSGQKTATFQSLESSLGWSSLQERGTWISWRIVQGVLTNCSWNACTWHELVGLTFYDQWTNLLDQSPNGQEHVTEYQLAWFHTFITRMTTDK